MAGVYIHIPFCKQKCSYCDFHFSTTFEKYRSKLIDSLTLEIKQRKDYLKEETIETIYFGGGTPSLLTYREIKKIKNSLYHAFTIAPTIEFTLEANPDDITKERLEEWKELGINRLSIGVQSFFQKDLDWMNRAHTVEDALSVLHLAKERNFFLTIDLIYGLPFHTLKELEYNINQLISFQTEHISAYCLTVEKGTQLQYMLQKGVIPSVGEDEQADQYEFLVEKLTSNGYEQYEISNFSHPGVYSKHNTNYWRGIKYIGIGPSAHSYNGKSRQWNVANNRKYIKGIVEDKLNFEKEILSPTDKFNELILTGLRTKWGVDMNKLFQFLNPTEDFHNIVNSFINDQSIRLSDNTLCLTKKGKLKADYIASSLFV